MTKLTALEMIQKLQEENEYLQKEVETLRNELQTSRIQRMKNTADINRLLLLLYEKPYTISELSKALGKEPRLISQWIFRLKTRFGAVIHTVGEGKKQLMNTEAFEEQLFGQKE